MKRHDRHGGTITFRTYVGSGTYGDVGFDLGVATTPGGTLLGLPVVDFHDERGTSVTIELEDVLAMAWGFATEGRGDDGD